MSPRKPSGARRQAILEAATRLFVEHGYAGTTTDAIIQAGGGSKESVYHHFGSKLGLFAAVVEHLTGGLLDSLTCPADEQPVDVALKDFGRRYLALILSPQSLGVYRLVIGEGRRQPELGRIFHEGAPGLVTAVLTEFLRRRADLGHLKLDDPAIAAGQLQASFRGPLHVRALMTGLPASIDLAAEIDRQVVWSVDLFMRAQDRF